MNRRHFFGLCAAAGVGACSSQPEPEPEPSSARMKLAMSVRVAESFSNKKESSMTIDELIDTAKSNGYRALCMRASTAGTHSPAETVSEYAAKIRAAGLAVSMVTGDFAIPMNNDDGPQCLRNITPYLDLAAAFGADLIRVCMKKEEDIAWAQRSCDEAQERSIRLAHQAHDAGIFETVDGSVDVLKKIDRENFGIIYEPANWMIADEPYGRAAIEQVRPWIFNVYVQNHRLNPAGETAVNTWKRGPVRVDHIGLWEDGGVEFERVFAALRAIGYEGYVTVHQAFEGVMTVDEAVRKSAAYLSQLIAR